MWVFYILLLTPLAIQHFTIEGHSTDHKKRNQIALFIFFVFLTVLVAMRHEDVGNDTRVYIHYFNKYNSMSFSSLRGQITEIGFYYFNRFIAIFTEEPQAFIAINSIIVAVMIYPTYKRMCLDPSLSIVIFCVMPTFVMMFSGIRQMMAIGIGFIAYEFTRNKKIIPYVLCVILAVLFHTSAFVLIFMYPLYHTRITKKWLLVVAPVLAFVFVFNREIFSVLTIILSRFTNYEGEVSSTGAFTMIILFFIFSVFAFLIPDDDKLDSETIGLRNFLLFSLLIQMFAPLYNTAMRMNYYYIIFIPLLMPKIIRYRSEKWSQIAILGRHVMVAFFLVYFFFTAARGRSLNVFPYHFFWEVV